MQYQDFSQIKELLINRSRYFFIDVKIATIILTVSLLLLLWQAYLIFALYSLNKLDVVEPFLQVGHINQVVSPGNDEPVSSLNMVNVDQYHLFGLIIKSGGSLAQAFKTSLPLVLKGVMAHVNPKHGQAIIKDVSGKEKNYNIGDKLPENLGMVTLEYIFKDRVFIKNNGVLEYILYPKLDLNTKLFDPRGNLKAVTASTALDLGDSDENYIDEPPDALEFSESPVLRKEKRQLKNFKKIPRPMSTKKLNVLATEPIEQINQIESMEPVEPTESIEPMGSAVNTTNKISKVIMMGKGSRSLARNDDDSHSVILKRLNKFKQPYDKGDQNKKK